MEEINKLCEYEAEGNSVLQFYAVDLAYEVTRPYIGIRAV
jgi:hypothetical protein